MEKDQKQANFDRMLDDYRVNRHWHFEEMDGEHREWPELSPEAKLVYLARDAVFADATPERFVQAAREFLGDLPPAAREEAALRLLLHREHELRGVERLLPSEDYLDPARTLAERVQEFFGDMQMKPDPQMIRQMLDKVETVTKSRFYEDPDPAAGPVEMFRMPEGKPGGEPFAALSVQEKWQVLDDYTDWHHYEARGVSYKQVNQVFGNVIEGKPREQWLEGIKEMPMAEKNPLSPEARESLIRETFDAYATVGMKKWEAEELALGFEVDEEGRKLCLQEFEKGFPDFHKLLANASDEHLLDTREYWIDKANTMGLTEWQDVLSKGEGGKPFYDLVAREVAENNKRREAAGATYQRSAEQQEAAQRNTAEQAKGLGESQGKSLGAQRQTERSMADVQGEAVERSKHQVQSESKGLSK